MRILFWVPYPSEGASNRLRIEQYLPFLKGAGIEYTLHAFWSKVAFKILYKKGYFFRKLYFFVLGTLSRIYDILRIYKYDIIFIHREAHPIFGSFFEGISSILNKSIIFDFDDAIFLPYCSPQNTFIERFKNPKKFEMIIKLSKYVIAGNTYLADVALKFNKNVQIIPTSIDADKYYPEIKKDKKEIIVGWIGSITTVGFVKMMEEVFIRISKEYRDIIFKIIGGDFSVKGINIITKTWLLNEEIGDLRTLDIGIMPMPDNKWTRGKCGFKAVLYMSMGIPCVCSPVGVNKEIITDGVNGFLAGSDDEWVEKLSLLIDNTQLRYKLGMAGRHTVEERYSIKKNAPKFLDIIQKVYRERDI